MDHESNGFSSTFKQSARETAVALGANAVFNGPAVDFGATGGGKLSATARADVVGTLAIQESPDSSTWTSIASVAAAQIGGSGNFLASVSVVTRARYLRVRYTNGAGAQASFALDRLAIAG